MTSGLFLHHSASFFSREKAIFFAASSVTLNGEARKESPLMSEEKSTRKPKGVFSFSVRSLVGDENRGEVLS